jgi:hypothetical protein
VLCTDQGGWVVAVVMVDGVVAVIIVDVVDASRKST